MYPVGEVLSYAYDAGGNVKFAQGVKQGVSFNYLTRLEYDKFEQRQYLAYGNGSTTQYAYDARNRLLARLQAVTQGRTFQNLAYRYDNLRTGYAFQFLQGVQRSTRIVSSKCGSSEGRRRNRR